MSKPKRLPRASLEYIKEHFTYHPSSGKLLKDGLPCVNPKGAVYIGPINDEPWRNVSAARLAWFLHTGHWCLDRFYFDNFDRLDLRLTNLTFAGHKRSRRKRNGDYLSKYKGVSWRSRTTAKPWISRINFRGTVYYLGVYRTEEEAALAYNDKAKEVFGDLAILNEVA